MTSLKIALVVEAMDTGVAELIASLTMGLSRRNHEIYVFHSIRRADSKILQRLQKQDRVTCIGLDMRRSAGLHDIAAAFRLRRMLSCHGPFDVVHGHSAKAGALMRLAAPGLPGVRVYTPHAFYTLDNDLGRLPRTIYSCVERLLAHLSDAVICSSSVERTHAVALGIPLARLTVILNGIEPMVLAPADRPKLGLGDSDTCVIGFIGRFERQKGPDILLRAVARLVSASVPVSLVMIGSGSMEQDLRRLAASLGIDRHVSWLGRRDSRDYLASFDILAQSSRYEGFSLMPLEAMSACLPIVCTPVGGIAESVIEGETGLIVPVDDPAALAQALSTLVRSPELRRSMGEASHRRASQFHSSVMVEEHECLYRALLEGRSPDKFNVAAAIARRRSDDQPLAGQY